MYARTAVAIATLAIFALIMTGCASSAEPAAESEDEAPEAIEPEPSPTPTPTPEPSARSLAELIRIPLLSRDGFEGAFVLTSWSEGSSLLQCYTQQPVAASLAAQSTQAEGYVELPVIDGFQWNKEIKILADPTMGGYDPDLAAQGVTALSCSPADTQDDLVQAGSGGVQLLPPHELKEPFTIQFQQLSEKTPNSPNGALDSVPKYPGLIWVSDVAVLCESLSNAAITVARSGVPNQCNLRLNG